MSKHRRPGPAKLGPIASPRVRRWLYGIAAAGAPLATVYGVTTEQEAVLWLNLAGAVLFVVAAGNTPSRPAEDDGEDQGEAL